MPLMPNGSHPYVTRVTFTGGQIMLTVEVDDFPDGVPVEISGYATQNGGAFANFYDIQSVTKNPDGTGDVYVTATPTQGFTVDDTITVVLRVARVWVTVIDPAGQNPPDNGWTQPGPTSTPPDNTVFDVIRKVAEVSPGAWASSAAEQGSAAGANFPGD